MPKHPQQPVVMVDGIKRFKINAVVRALLDSAQSSRPFGLNDIWLIADSGGFSREDMKQFYQLIGSSASAYLDLFDDVEEEDIGMPDEDVDDEADAGSAAPGLAWMVRELQEEIRTLHQLQDGNYRMICELKEQKAAVCPHGVGPGLHCHKCFDEEVYGR